MNEFGVTRYGVNFATQFFQLCIRVLYVFQLSRAYECKVCWIEYEYRPFTQHVCSANFYQFRFLKASSVNSGSCLPIIDMLCPPYLSSIFNEYIYIGVLNTISISIFVYIITNIIQYCKRYFKFIDIFSQLFRCKQKRRKMLISEHLSSFYVLQQTYCSQ